MLRDRRKSNRKYGQSDKGKVALKRCHAKYYLNHSFAILARRSVRAEIDAGRLAKVTTVGCHFCAGIAEQYHHAKGYAKKNWLIVMPVCNECHMILTRLKKRLAVTASRTASMFAGAVGLFCGKSVTPAFKDWA